MSMHSKINFVISLPNYVTYVVGTQKNHLNEHPKHMFKLMNKKIITILCKNSHRPKKNVCFR